MSLLRLSGVTLALFAALTCMLRAQEDRKSNSKPSVYDELANAPGKYRSKANPLGRDLEAVTAGAILFEEHCQECHGKEAGGGKKAPSLRVAEVQNAEPGAIYYVLTNGVVRKGMPVWSKLPEPQRWQLVSYIKSLGAAEAQTASPKKP
jgi:mono/diheme cytochrome c family protein